MKKSSIVLFTLLLLGSCTLFGPNPEYSQGMTEKKFLRQNKEAVLSGLDGGIVTYRVVRDNKFYVLATFEKGVLVKLEERELAPAWMPNQPQMPIQNNNNNNNIPLDK
ncbi:hypothetical protein [Rhodonellum sp.]|uniref:hypothetical protein n=1 Tax=Rhodonellum sp. TaxID=2231180 RepID=UPI0027229568|nr:hypothetical protein [Rhodonellum sp.]MDO9554144.1 hypothetical protein [Rhodonellum sp.]